MPNDKPGTNLPAFLDDSNPYALTSLIEGEAFANAVKKIPEQLLTMEEEELRKLAKPTKTDYAIRTALWNEIRISSVTGQSIKPPRIYAGICSYQNWYHNILNASTKLAWILQPLREYERSLEPMLARIAERYDELLNMNIYDEKGRPIPSLVRSLQETIRMIEYRVKGSVVERMETKNLNLQIDAYQQDPFVPESMEAIDKRLAELEERAHRHLGELKENTDKHTLPGIYPAVSTPREE